MRSLILLISMLTTTWFSLLADRVDVNTARKIAETVASGNLRSAGSVTLSYAAAAQQEGMLRSAGPDEPADYYVFNIGKRNGFVIVSGLDCTTPVLGYSDEGTFDPDHVNPGLRGMLAYYQRQIAYAEEHQLEAADKDKAAWLQLQSGLSLRSGDILHETATWGQEDPYNLYTPLVPETGEHTPTGCGATATAIVLRYFQHPDKCVNGVTEQAGQNISYIDYNWASMPLEEPTTDDGKRQVASIMREIGANLDMQYTADGSSSDAALIPKVLKNNFDYNKGGIYYFKENFNWEDWHTMLRSQLNKGPVIYRGASSEEGGHIFVVDGYQDLDIYYHINWGWDGYMNGWYALTAMCQEAPFTEGQGMVYNSYPNTTAYTSSINRQATITDYDDLPTGTGSYEITYELWNNSTIPYQDVVILVRYDTDDDTYSILAKYPVHLEPGYLIELPFEYNLDSELADTEFIMLWDYNRNRMLSSPGKPYAITRHGFLYNGEYKPGLPGDEIMQVSLEENGLAGNYYQSGLDYRGTGNLGYVDLQVSGYPTDMVVKMKIGDYDAWEDQIKFKYGVSTDGTQLSSSALSDIGISPTGEINFPISGSSITEDVVRLTVQPLVSQTGNLSYTWSVWSAEDDPTEYIGATTDTWEFLPAVQASFGQSEISFQTDQPQTLHWTCANLPAELEGQALAGKIQIGLKREDFVLKRNGETISFSQVSADPNPLSVANVNLVESVSGSAISADFELTVKRACSAELRIIPDFEISEDTPLSLSVVDPTAIEVNVSGLQHITVTNLADRICVGDRNVTLHLAATSGYQLPSVLTVTMNGITLSNVYNASTGTVTIEEVTGDIKLAGSADFEPGYTCAITFDLGEKLHHDYEGTTAQIGSQVAFRITAESGYSLPNTLTVTMDGQELVAGSDYNYNSSNGSFDVGEITGALCITGAAVPNNYGEATYQLDHITLGVHTGDAIHGSSFECQLTADDGYDLPATVKIEMNGTLLETGYTFENGLVRILSVTGPVKITAEATLKSYTLTATLSNLSCEPASGTEFRHGEALSVKLQATAGYKLPSEVTASMNGTQLTADKFNYDPSTGVIRIAQVTGPVTITASAIQLATYTVTTELHDVMADIESGHSIQEGSSLTIRLTAAVGFKLPASVSLQQGENTLTAGTDYTYDSGTGQLVIQSVQGNLKLTAHGVDDRHYEIQFTLTGLKTEPAVIAPILHGRNLSFKLEPAEGYRLPQTLASVKVDDIPVSADTYTYNATTGEFQMNGITKKVSIEATGQRIYYSVTATLQHLTCDLTADLTVAHGEGLTVRFTADAGYLVPESITVKLDGNVLTSGYSYENGVLTLTSVKGAVEIIANAEQGVIVTEQEKELTESTPYISVKTDGNVQLSLDHLENRKIDVSSSSAATIQVKSASQIEQLVNAGTTTLTSVGSAKLNLQKIVNNGTLKLDESLQLQAAPASVTNNGTFEDRTGTVKKVGGDAALELTATPSSQISYTVGMRYTLNVKVKVSSERIKTVFEWQKKQNNSWQTVSREEKSQTLRSAASEELTASYTLPRNDYGTFRCVVTNHVTGDKQTSLLTETKVTVSDPGVYPDPDPKPEPEPTPTPTPTPDPTAIYKVTLPVVEGATVTAIGSTTLEKGSTFKFEIKVASGYLAKNLVVKANGQVILPDANGIYIISNISENIIVTITGIEAEPTGLETMTNTDRVWVESGQIYVNLADDGMIQIYNEAGKKFVAQPVSAGQYVYTLQTGHYFVQISRGDKVYVMKCWIR